MKKLMALMMALFMLVSVSITAFATENGTEETEDFSQNHNVTDVCPWEQITTYGVNPPTEGWDIFEDGVYEFSGKAAYSTLYLSYLIYGADCYIAEVTNRSYTDELKVVPHDVTPTATIPVAARDTLYEDFMLKAGKTYFCLSFLAPSDFEGTIYGDYYQ